MGLSIKAARGTTLLCGSELAGGSGNWTKGDNNSNNDSSQILSASIWKPLYCQISSINLESSDTPEEGVPLLPLFTEAAAEIQGGAVS